LTTASFPYDQRMPIRTRTEAVTQASQPISQTSKPVDTAEFEEVGLAAACVDEAGDSIVLEAVLNSAGATEDVAALSVVGIAAGLSLVDVAAA
jgi:hypothetical protein